MASISTNMQLTLWDSLTDPYDSSELVDNFVKLDAHNHTSAKGVKIPNGGLVDTVGSEAVNTNVIQNSAITTDKINNLSVTNDKIGNTAVSEAKLANSAVTENKLANGSVTENKLADSSVTSAKIVNNTIINEDIHNTAGITYGKLNLSNSIVNADVASAAAIAYGKLNLLGAVTNNDLAGSIAPSKITNTAVTLSDTQTVTNKTFTDNVTFFQDQTTNSKKMQFELSGISSDTTRTLTVPDANGTIALTTSNISGNAATATKLLNGAKINGVNFTGQTDILVSGNPTGYRNYLPKKVSTTGTYSSSSNTITSVSKNTYPPYIGLLVSGNNIPDETRITNVTGSGPYTLTIDKQTTGSGTGATIYYGSDPLNGEEIYYSVTPDNIVWHMRHRDSTRLSTTSLTVSSGTKTLTINNTIDYFVGGTIIVTALDNLGNPTANLMTGTISQVTPTEITFGTGLTSGSGTYSSWQVKNYDLDINSASTKWEYIGGPPIQVTGPDVSTASTTFTAGTGGNVLSFTVPETAIDGIYDVTFGVNQFDSNAGGPSYTAVGTDSTPPTNALSIQNAVQNSDNYMYLTRTVRMRLSANEVLRMYHKISGTTSSSFSSRSMLIRPVFITKD